MQCRYADPEDFDVRILQYFPRRHLLFFPIQNPATLNHGYIASVLSEVFGVTPLQVTHFLQIQALVHQYVYNADKFGILK